jgi:hypothetical protein
VHFAFDAGLDPEAQKQLLPSQEALDGRANRLAHEMP